MWECQINPEGQHISSRGLSSSQWHEHFDLIGSTTVLMGNSAKMGFCNGPWWGSQGDLGHELLCCWGVFSLWLKQLPRRCFRTCGPWQRTLRVYKGSKLTSMKPNCWVQLVLWRILGQTCQTWSSQAWWREKAGKTQLENLQQISAFIRTLLHLTEDGLWQLRQLASLLFDDDREKAHLFQSCCQHQHRPWMESPRLLHSFLSTFP